MLSGIWNLIGLLRQLFDLVAAALGYIRTVEHQKAVSEIHEDTKIVGDPTKTEQERNDAAKRLQDRLNRHT